MYKCASECRNGFRKEMSKFYLHFAATLWFQGDKTRQRVSQQRTRVHEQIRDSWTKRKLTADRRSFMHVNENPVATVAISMRSSSPGTVPCLNTIQTDSHVVRLFTKIIQQDSKVHDPHRQMPARQAPLVGTKRGFLLKLYSTPKSCCVQTVHCLEIQQLRCCQ